VVLDTTPRIQYYASMRRPLSALAARYRGPSLRTPSPARPYALALALAALVLAVLPRPPLVAVGPTTTHEVGRVAAPLTVLVARARTEPALALDPRDSQRIAAVANPDFFGLFPDEPLNGTFASSDGGATWAQGTAPTYGRFTGVADPSVGFDAAGRAYYLWMGETPAFCGQNSNVALLLARSLDGGRTYGPPTVVDVDRADDKPYLAVSSQGGRTAIYATFTRWLDSGSQILLTRSLDGGQTFTTPTVLYATPGVTVNFASLPIVGPKGHVYVVWAHYHRFNYYGPLQASIMLRASSDGGRTFGPVVIIASFTGLPQMIVPGGLRVFTLPAAGVDMRSGALYVTWVQARAMAQPRYPGEMDADLVLSRSRDGGHTWTPPAVLNDTPLGDRFDPALSVGPGGVVRVSFYDRRADHARFALYGVAVRDLGPLLRLWPNRQISPELSSPATLPYAYGSCVAPGRFMGDYIAAATAPDGTFATMWTDTALGRPKETDLWFARVPPRYLQAGTPRLVGW
jgi:hypothetical protein